MGLSGQLQAARTRAWGSLMMVETRSNPSARSAAIVMRGRAAASHSLSHGRLNGRPLGRRPIAKLTTKTRTRMTNVARVAPDVVVPCPSNRKSK